MEKTTQEKAAPHPQIPSASSQSSSRRTSGANTREALPTPPPDPREFNVNTASSAASDNIFQYPAVKKTDLPIAFHSLLNCGEREKEFYRTLNEAITKDCSEAHIPPKSEMSPNKLSNPTIVQQCDCDKMREEFEQFIDPLNNRLNASLPAALAAYGAVEQLTRLYSIWDQYLDVEKKLRQRKECLRYVHLLQEKIKPTQKDTKDLDPELDQSMALLDTMLATGTSASMKRSQMKQQRERSKSMMIDDITGSLHPTGEVKHSTTIGCLGPPLLRRQSTYSEGKSKVSKWTKVKAAFKWERANVPALNDSLKDMPNGIGLLPINHEVARYLRVPSVPCGGGSSTGSILSSSSGHLLSEAGTPGTVSSASSMDDIDNTGRNTLRRDSSKSDSRTEIRKIEDSETMSSFPDFGDQILFRSDSSKSNPAATMLTTSKSSSNKSIRKSKVVSDFEALPEDVIADIKSTPTRRLKPPPSPLDLNLKQDLSDLDYVYSPSLLKVSKDGTQSLNRLKKISSPGNSSVPSSPSRHSDFFAEFESEDLSSGDFSEPSSPSRKTFQQKQDEINQRYQMLRAKLDMEFAAKRQEWEKMRTNPNTCAISRMSSITRSEEHSPNSAYNPNLSAKLLEENLTPDFKKKLRKWRVKKQISLQHQHSPHAISPHSPNKDVKENIESKPKIDWNLWKTGQIKLEGQGLTPLPDQKDLPEDFQKKLEQWNKIKRGGSIAGGGDPMKRSTKHGDSTKKGSDEDRSGCMEKEKRVDKHKTHDKDKSEKLAKLKAIVADHPVKAKEIEVKTSAGVMKFEGISRKFTRKLYEWEKARGIGPESSTFALLHPGYCPIDVGRISKDNNKNDNSPTLSRSLSLDSISPNVMLPTAMSHQASSLSLNDVNDLKSELDGVSSSDPLGENTFKHYEEPEAVMVEVEDHIVETASPLITAQTRVEQQTPVYKYEEVACNDYCNSRRIQSYESHTNLAPLLSALKRSDELFTQLKKTSADIAEKDEVCRCERTISLIRSIYPYYTENLTKANVLNAISDVQSELSRLTDLHQKLPLDEACCQEIMEERNKEYNEEFNGLYESLQLLRQSIQGGTNRYPQDIVPDINITAEDAYDNIISPLQQAACDSSGKDQLSTTLEATDELSASHLENETETTTTTTARTTVQRSYSSATANGNSGKKKLRLRKMGSRQNSKTESSNSSDDDAQHNAMETPRRLKRKNFRYKQRSFESDDFRRSEEPIIVNDDIHYMLKVKPGHPIEQCNNVYLLDKKVSKPLLASKEPFARLVPCDGQVPALNELYNQNSNVFVKTKRKVFTTVKEPTAIDGVAVVAQDVDANSQESVACCQATESKPELSQSFSEASTEFFQHKKGSKLKRKSLSQADVRCKVLLNSLAERKFVSADDINRYQKSINVRRPLASDSFRVISKGCGTLVRDSSNHGTAKRMELRFKKNPDISYLQQAKCSNARMVKKIETKIAKSHSGSSVDGQPISTLATANRDNTIPGIYLQTERNASNATIQDLRGELAFSTVPATPLRSPPSTPIQEMQFFHKPCTPLSERAQRLKKAKEDFLQGTMPRPKPSFKRRDEIVRTEMWEQYRRSDQSLSSVTTTGGDDLSNSLLKSFSDDTVRGSGMDDTPTQSEAGTDMDVATGIYDSLPRAVTRSGKISSKLGFATLASKFRRVKVKGKNKEPSGGNGALSALCRQALFADPLGVPQIVTPDGIEDHRPPQENLMKSQSSPQARVSPSPSSSETSYLNKSQSEQIVRPYQKESYV